MSDEWNFHDAVEDGIRDNAGHLVVAGALMAHSQRKEQILAMEAMRQQQAEIAKTEQERLKVEKQRLELEHLKQRAEKDEKEAVRLLRVLMAEVGAEFEGLASRGVLAVTPKGVRQDYRMALLLTKLAVVRTRNSVLSDLGDIKEMTRLEGQAKDLIERHFANRNPLEITSCKWKELEAWADAVKELNGVVNHALAAVPSSSSVNITGLDELREIQVQLTAMQDDLASKLVEYVEAEPDEAMDVDGLFPELVEQAQFEDMREGRKITRVSKLSSCQAMVKGRPSELIRQCETAMTRLQEWIAKHSEHQRILVSANQFLQQGNLTSAQVDLAKLGKVRFADLSYAVLEELTETQQALKNLQSAKRSHAVKLADKLLRRSPEAPAQSQLKQEVAVHMARGVREKRNLLILIGVLTCLVGFVAKSISEHHREVVRLAAEEEAKIQAELREFEKLAAEARVKTEMEKLERERLAEREKLAAEKRVKVEAEKRERLAGEEKAKMETEKREREGLVGEAKKRENDKMSEELLQRQQTGALAQNPKSPLAGIPTRIPSFAGWEIIEFGGRDYVTAESIRDFYNPAYGFTTFSEQGDQLTIGSSKLVLKAIGGSQEMRINNIKFMLSFPVASKNGKVLLSRLDLCKLIDPVLHPSQLKHAEYFDTVVLDASHGGKDTGAHGVHGYEKDFALKLALAVGAALQQRGFKVIHTRPKDMSLTSVERVAIANKTPKSIFISLHFNTSEDDSETGIETWALAPQSSADILPQPGAYIANAVRGDRQDSASIALATAVHASVISRFKFVDRGVKRAQTETLVMCKRPSIIFMGGFISNAQECLFIGSEAFHEQVSAAIGDAVMNYRKALH